MPRNNPNDFYKNSLNRSKRPKCLKKLKFFCQMCEKQCTDENGFKRHCATESHKYQIALFVDNPDFYINKFSDEFENDFISLLKRKYADNSVNANNFYQDFIKDPNHIHMNSTKWDSLMEFISYLGDKKIVKIEDTEKGIMIQYINKEIQSISKSKIKKERNINNNIIHIHKEEISDKEEKREIIEFQKNEDKKISFAFKKGVINKPLVDNAIEEELSNVAQKSITSDVVEKINIEGNNSEDAWVLTGIVVKVATDKLGSEFNGRKGVIQDVENKYVATVKMIETGSLIKLDQLYLKNVIPPIGRELVVLHSNYRGCKGKLLSLDEKNKTVRVQLYSEPFNGRVIDNLSINDISKLAS